MDFITYTSQATLYKSKCLVNICTMKVQQIFDLIILMWRIITIAILFPIIVHCQQSPLIYQFLIPYNLPVNDLATVVSDDFASVTISPASTSYVNLSNFKTVTQYLGTNRTFINTSVVERTVLNDSLIMTITYDAGFNPIGKKAFVTNCTVKVSLLFNYTKYLNLTLGYPNIIKVNNSLSSKPFDNKCQATLNSNQTSHLQQALTAEDGKSLYLQLLRVVSQTMTLMNKHAKNETIGQTYPQNPYKYTYQTNTVAVGVDTLAVSASSTGIRNQLSGTINGTTHSGSIAPDYVPSYHSYYSLSFMFNLLEYFVKYPLTVNRNNANIKTFKFRLADLQFVLSNIVDKYPSNYLSEVQFRCNNLNNNTLNIVSQTVVGNAQWLCSGYILNVSDQHTYGLNQLNDLEQQGVFDSFNTLNKDQKVIDIDVILNYTAEIHIDASGLQVTITNASIVNAAFTGASDEYKVINEELAMQYLQSVVQGFIGINTFGTKFAVKTGSNKVLLNEGGLWVGTS